MSRYRGEPTFRHDEIPATGVLLVNLGTPDAPTPKALRRYLREFLADPRVVELPRPLWWLILNLFVLPLRPRRSAALYRKIWRPEGSPLLLTGRAQAAKLEGALRGAVGSPLHVVLGMRYGKPSIANALDELRAKACRRILLLPLYPQYAGPTTGSTFAAVTAELARRRWVPELRTVNSYHDDDGYIGALVASIREAWSESAPASRLMFSFHGMPKRSILAGDPYFCHCQKTARRVGEALELPADRILVTFQSRFGREEWLQPYTIDAVRRLAAEGVESLDVICPGFAADCLETFEEIALLNRDAFLAAGGKRFRYIPALGDRDDHIEALARIALRHLHGWIVPHDEWREDAAQSVARDSLERARRLGGS